VSGVAAANDSPPLTPAQLAEAEALWRQVRFYELMGVRMIVVSPGDPIRLRPVGQAVELTINENQSRMSLTE